MSESKSHLEDWLDDLCVRFIINLPREELESVERICFQVEEAQWFYEDFIRPLNPALPSLSLKAFALRIFQHCPLMSQWSRYHHLTAFSEFLAYKTRVPVRGAIMLNHDMDEVVLVKGWKKNASWSFPRGKINKGERDLDCAVREVFEETGFDLREAGLVKDEGQMKFIEITMREQHMKLYVFRDVPRDTHFEPRTRKEISKIKWYKMSELPTLKKSKQHDSGPGVVNASKFYMVAPFMHSLKRWIAEQKKQDADIPATAKDHLGADEGVTDDVATAARPVNEMVILSDLPEVAPAKEASLQLKRLLNINGPTAPTPSANFMQPSTSDSSKSDALLALLRSGSQDTRRHSQGIKPHVSRTLVSGESNPQVYHAPGFFPGFPPQPPHTDVSVPLWQGHLKSHHPPILSFPPQLGTPPQRMSPSSYLRRSQDQTSVLTSYPPLVPLARELTQASRPTSEQAPAQTYPSLAKLPPSQGFQEAPSALLAPYQRTGDPQFSQHAQKPRTQGATVPPASKLPPPKLTSHSLALLRYFKDVSPESPKISDVFSASHVEQSPEGRRLSQHRDALLDLLKGTSSSTEHAELPAQASQVRFKGVIAHPKAEATVTKQNSTGQRTSIREGQTSATVSGPLNMPYFDAILKRPPKKSTNGTNPKAQKEQLTQKLASPITILSRPQTAKADSSAAMARTPQSPQAQFENLKTTNTNKPFQPQILRRGVRPEPDVLPSAQANKSPQMPIKSMFIRDAVSENRDAEPKINFTRASKQTAAQKEALLALFGKPSAPSKTSLTVSPLPSASVQRTHPHIFSPPSQPRRSSKAADSTSRASPATSPVDKTFLLEFLQSATKKQK